ncbi:MAG: thiamine phosphate synthase [Nocardioidaceae bacterium]
MFLTDRLHLVTDTRDGRDPLPVVEAALRAGVGCVQVRAKRHTDRELAALTGQVLMLASMYASHDGARQRRATVIVDDRADVAVATGADGVHVGADDLTVEEVRRVLGPTAVVGVTARDPQTARTAAKSGASYLGVGPAFTTETKTGLPDPLGVAGVGAVADSVQVPVIAIGGVGAGHIPDLLSAGVHGVAVVSAVSDAADPEAAAAELVRLTGCCETAQTHGSRAF